MKTNPVLVRHRSIVLLAFVTTVVPLTAADGRPASAADADTVKSGTIAAGPFQLRYRIEGTGMPLLVVGDPLYSARTFSANLRPHLRLVFVDHRGMVQPNRPLVPEDFSFATIIDDIERVRTELQIGPVAVLGHSGHAFMALEYAKKYPAQVSHVVMLGIGPDLGPASQAEAERYWQESVSPERKAALAENRQRLPDEALAKLPPDERFVRWYVREGPKFWFDPRFDCSPLWENVRPNMQVIDHIWGEVFRDIDITRGLERFDRPVLIGLGRYDFAVAPPASWERLRPKFKDLTIRVFERSGHTPQYEEPEFFDAELLRWLNAKPAKPPTAWIDPARHASREVRVNGVRLHTLDWGGNGHPLILIPGSANGAHAYDALAPLLADKFRVVSYARRGDGRSEDKGPYDVDTLVEDLRQLLDAFGIEKAHLAGWSLGGFELTRFAGLHPARVGKLVYLDAAYDWYASDILNKRPTLPLRPTAADLRSLDSYRTWFTERSIRAGAPWSDAVEAYARDFLDEEPDGRLRFRLPDAAGFAKRHADRASYRQDYRAVHAPALAIYVRDFLPTHVGDAAKQATVRRWTEETWVPWLEIQRAKFAAEMRNGRSVLLEAGNHMSFIFTHEREVARIMRDFLLDDSPENANQRTRAAVTGGGATVRKPGDPLGDYRLIKKSGVAEAMSDAAVVPEVTAKIEAYVAALRSLDFERATGHYLNDPQFRTYFDGQESGYADFVAGVRESLRQVRDFEGSVDGLVVTPLAPDAALASFRFVRTLTDSAGTVARHRGTTTWVWVKRDGEWRIIHGHAVHIPMP